MTEIKMPNMTRQGMDPLPGYKNQKDSSLSNETIGQFENEREEENEKPKSKLKQWLTNIWHTGSPVSRKIK